MLNNNPNVNGVSPSVGLRVCTLWRRAINNAGSLDLNNCTITGNTSDVNGGGLENNNEAVVTNCTFQGNTATVNGGAIAAEFTTRVINCTIGGIFSEESNIASTGNGGGIDATGNLTLEGCTIVGNTATAGNGGGIENAKSVAMTNCTITRNTAGGTGGGLDNSPETFARVEASTIVGNTATQGGGIYNKGSEVHLYDSIVANNTGGDVAGHSFTTQDGNALYFIAYYQNGNNLFGDSAIVTDDPSGLHDDGGNQFSADPLLGPLQNKVARLRPWPWGRTAPPSATAVSVAPTQLKTVR